MLGKAASFQLFPDSFSYSRERADSLRL